MSPSNRFLLPLLFSAFLACSTPAPNEVRTPASRSDGCAAVFQDPRSKGLSGLEIVAKLEKEIAQDTQEIDGIPKERLIKELASDKDLQWIASDLLQEHVAFAINSTEESRDGIAENGFLNQYQTRSSRGEYTPEFRLKVEAFYCGLSVEEYSKIPLDERPKYGYLAPEIGSKLRRNRNVAGYGPDVYYFKKDLMRPVTSWVAGDSLDQYMDIVNEVKKNRDYPLRSRRFIPWSDKGLILMHLKQGGADESNGELSLLDLGYASFTTDAGTKIRRYDVVMQDYIELQFWRKPTLDYAETFIYYNNPPKGKFLKALKDRGISIYHHIGPRRPDLVAANDAVKPS